MIIIVAGKAFIVQSQKCSLAFFDVPVMDIIRCMAVTAVYHFVLALEFITCSTMVEIIFIEADHIKFTTVMVAMTFETILTANFPVRVKTSVLVYQGFDFFMAIEAFGVGHLVSQFMAQGAITHPFQISVCLGKVTGGNLSR
ncbi:MAG: hypothetical protein DWQ02_21785 [Bacteroidetes bacterium]|nr:MAG: hypothetical protein DWQ02_21785 [Bacteroidota bacterium]